MYRESFFSTRAVWCYSGARGEGETTSMRIESASSGTSASEPLDRRRRHERYSIASFASLARGYECDERTVTVLTPR